MMDRKIAPEIKEIDTIHFVQPQVFDVTKGNQLICMTDVQNETAKFELYFDAGSIHGGIEVAAVVNSLLMSGTATKSATDISKELDGLGAYLDQSLSMENAVVSVHALRENILPIARVLFDAIENCVFDETEIRQNLSARKQSLSVNMEKVNVLAQRAFKQRFFNSSEAYSRVTNEVDLDAIQQQDLIEFHKTNYLQGLNKLVLVGNFTQDEINEFMTIFSSWTSHSSTEFEPTFENVKGYSHIEKEGALQTAVRIGRPLFNKTHKDYPDFLILNTIVGDYFGSRLMRNIREDKGYTYGIGSMVIELEETGYFMIGTEVGKDVKDNALAEIKLELDKLKTKLVDQEELDLVKNYMLGQLLKSADGPYAMMDLYLSVEHYGLELEFYNTIIHHINTITPERIKELAQIYLNWDDFTIITAG